MGQKDTEFYDHLELIFKYLILDIKENLQTKFPNIILVLYDYVPFAKYSTLLRIKKTTVFLYYIPLEFMMKWYYPKRWTLIFLKLYNLHMIKKGLKRI